jgi:hypothetical protein
MAREIETSKKVEVDGFVYLINHPQVEEAWDIGIELSKIVAAPAASMATAGKDEETAGKALSNAVQGLMQKLDGKSSMALIRRILKSVEVQGEVDGPSKKMLLDQAGINTHFHARPGSMMRLVGEVVVFTHRGFFEAIKETLQSLMA